MLLAIQCRSEFDLMLRRQIAFNFQTVYPDESAIFPLFRLSFLWITPVGVCTVLVVGVLVSFLTGKTDLECLDPDLISPVAQWILPERAQRYAGSAIKKARHRELAGSDHMARDMQILAKNVLVCYQIKRVGCFLDV